MLLWPILGGLLLDQRICCRSAKVKSRQLNTNMVDTPASIAEARVKAVSGSVSMQNSVKEIHVLLTALQANQEREKDDWRRVLSIGIVRRMRICAQCSAGRPNICLVTHSEGRCSRTVSRTCQPRKHPKSALWEELTQSFVTFRLRRHSLMLTRESLMRASIPGCGR